MTDTSLPHVSGTNHNGVLVATITASQLRDAPVVFAVRDQISALMNESQATIVVIDMGNIQFIGSVGFLAFLAVRRQLKDGRIILCNMSDRIRELFELCRLLATDAKTTAPFESAATLESALACCAA